MPNASTLGSLRQPAPPCTRTVHLAPRMHKGFLLRHSYATLPETLVPPATAAGSLVTLLCEVLTPSTVRVSGATRKVGQAGKVCKRAKRQLLRLVGRAQQAPPPLCPCARIAIPYRARGYALR